MAEATSPAWGHLDDAQLGARLHSLGAEIELPDIDLVAPVRAALDEAAAGATKPERSRRALAVAAVVILLAGVLVFSIAPARTAVADWLGIGRTSVVVVDVLPEAAPTTPPTAPPVGEPPGLAPIRQAAADELDIIVKLPDDGLVGPPTGWEIRQTDIGSELVVAWPDFTFTARSAFLPPTGKIVTIREVVSPAITTDGEPALWIAGFHVREVGDLLEQAGNALLWVDGNVEYRLSGNMTEADAIEVASSIS